MRRVRVEIQIRDGETRSFRTFAAREFIPLHGEDSIDEAFKFSKVAMIEQLEEAERLAFRVVPQTPHRLD
jgi:hypothetical protein